MYKAERNSLRSPPEARRGQKLTEFGARNRALRNRIRPVSDNHHKALEQKVGWAQMQGYVMSEVPYVYRKQVSNMNVLAVNKSECAGPGACKIQVAPRPVQNLAMSFFCSRLFS